MKYTDPTGYIPYEFKMDAYFNWMTNRDINYAHDGVYYGDGFYKHVGQGKLYSMMGGGNGSNIQISSTTTYTGSEKAGLDNYEGGENVPTGTLTTFYIDFSSHSSTSTTENYNNANSYYPYSNGSYMGRMYAGSSQIYIPVTNDFLIDGIRFGVHFKTIGKQQLGFLGGIDKQLNAFNHIASYTAMYMGGINIDRLRLFMYIHEFGEEYLNQKDTKLDRLNNALVIDKYIPALDELNLKYMDSKGFIKDILYQMHKIGYYRYLNTKDEEPTRVCLKYKEYLRLVNLLSN